MKYLFFNIFIIALCYFAGVSLAFILAPVLLIKETCLILMLSVFFALFFFIMSLFIRDHFS